MEKIPRAAGSHYLCCPLFAFVGACENIQRKSDPSCARGVFLRTLINVDSSQIYIDARCAPSREKERKKVFRFKLEISTVRLAKHLRGWMRENTSRNLVNGILEGGKV